MLYTRPSRLPERSARRLTVVGLEITMSAVVSPSPPSFSTSSEVTQVMAGFAWPSPIIPLHESLMATPQSAIDFVTYLWLGGHSGPAPAAVTTGGVRSTTAICRPQADR